MENKISAPTFAAKLSFFEAQFEKNRALGAALQEEAAIFAALFPNKNAYEGILKKTLILNAENKSFEVQNLKDPSTFQTSIFVPLQLCPKLFVETNSNYIGYNSLGLKVKAVKNLEKEYCLLFDGEGNLFLVLPSATAKAEIYSFFSASNLLILDLPLIIAGIIAEKKAGKAQLVLKELVSKNPTSTFANICNYVKNNKKEIEALAPNLEILAKTITAATSSEEKRKAEAKISLVRTFPVTGYTLQLPFMVAKLDKIPLLKLDVLAPEFRSNSYREIGSDFPVLLVPEGTCCVPYFMGEKAFKLMLEGSGKNIFAGSPEKIKGLLTLEEKIREVNEKIEAMAEKRYENLCEDDAFPTFEGSAKASVSAEQFAYLVKNIEVDAEIAKENVKQELQKNVTAVLAAFDHQLENIATAKLIATQEKLLASFKQTNQQCNKKILELTKTLGKIYQKEILLANL